jgi:glycosyltransferase involved in cell wall biosynthesis
MDRITTPHEELTLSSVRICIVQSMVPHYRVPVFERLAQQPGMDLEVWAGVGKEGSSLEAADPSGRFRFVAAPKKIVGPFLSQPKQLEAIDPGRFDVVILSWNARCLQLGKALGAARKAGIKTLIWGHGYSRHEAWARRFNRNRYLRKADACLLYNHIAAQQLLSRGYPKEKIFVALNAIDQTPIAAARDLWLARSDALNSFQREQGLTSASGGGRRCDLILFVSRLEADKRVDLLLEAFAKVLHARPTARLAIIGRGPERAKLEVQASALGIANAVRFTGGIYDEDQLAPWFLSASVFAYPQAIGLSILHAFGYGVPVITSDDLPSHNPEIEALRQNENGALYRDGDTADFAAAMLRILGSSADHERMSAAALSTVSDPTGFTLDRMVQGFVDAIQCVHALR